VQMILGIPMTFLGCGNSDASGGSSTIEDRPLCLAGIGNIVVGGVAAILGIPMVSLDKQRSTWLSVGHVEGGLEVMTREGRRMILPGQTPLPGLPREAVPETIEKNIAPIDRCYSLARISKPELKGEVTVRFFIGGDGKVVSAVITSSELHNDYLENCIVESLRSMVFPAPKGGELVGVGYRFRSKYEGTVIRFFDLIGGEGV